MEDMKKEDPIQIQLLESVGIDCHSHEDSLAFTLEKRDDLVEILIQIAKENGGLEALEHFKGLSVQHEYGEVLYFFYNIPWYGDSG